MSCCWNWWRLITKKPPAQFHRNKCLKTNNYRTPKETKTRTRILETLNKVQTATKIVHKLSRGRNMTHLLNHRVKIHLKLWEYHLGSLHKPNPITCSKKRLIQRKKQRFSRKNLLQTSRHQSLQTPRIPNPGFLQNGRNSILLSLFLFCHIHPMAWKLMVIKLVTLKFRKKGIKKWSRRKANPLPLLRPPQKSSQDKWWFLTTQNSQNSTKKMTRWLPAAWTTMIFMTGLEILSPHRTSSLTNRIS